MLIVVSDSDTVFVESGMAPASEASSSTLTTYVSGNYESRTFLVLVII